ncbi:MAG TPA: hypothetical protein VNB06_06530 [Thermoanaerobaculia bacterium]|nr:hypothetical protein [Thermoanaerobaculia bacterium]
MKAATGSTLELWPDPRKVRRGRLLALFLLLNWVAMGWLVLAQGLRSLPGLLAFGFGLLTLLGGLSQLRGARLASSLPLVRVGPDRIESRFYSGGELRPVELSQVKAVRRASREEIVLALGDGGEVSLPCLALAEADRHRLEATIRSLLE